MSKEPVLKQAWRVWCVWQADKFVRLVRKGGRQAEGFYVYDVSLQRYLPSLLPSLRIPAYFAHCFLPKTRQTHELSMAWPTLFMGAQVTSYDSASLA